MFTVYLNYKAKSDVKLTKKWSISATVSEAYLPTKGVSEGYDIIIVYSRHCEAVVKLKRVNYTK